MAGALQDVRVLDLSRVLAGPWAGQVLADLGAEVVKVERPGSGDDTRGWGPPFLKDEDGQDTGEAAYYLSANRGKRSIAVDMASADGLAVIGKLVGWADVVIENFKVGGLAKYGLDYASLSADHPGLIYCSITGFGQTGPYRARAGYDVMIQAMGGLMSITGRPDDAPGGGPQKAGVAIADISTGLYAVIAILAALHHRDRTGQGQHIDLALLDTQVGWLANQNMNYLVTGASPARRGNAHPNIVPYQDFATADGAIIVAVGNDGQFARFAAAIGRPELADDARFATNAARVANRDTLIPLIAERLAGRTTADWAGLLDSAQVNIPNGPINTIAQAFDDPQLRHRGLRVDLPHPLAGTVATVASPINLSATPPEYHRPPPLLGEHTDDVLAELGLDAAAIADLRAKGAVA